ncbi:hypothetical protein T440DRAFT_483091 [Plenodomus tracheiphilus IPT5]|uniref:Uncharacterized protein n=1 Tax=Plenodomus tracheiphilus IPT5 TaxID=1408161 RepID=A0A6A7AR12_9PLEO|nr:hypothetical protein T440DRAFT_483091 [Plenodomus tracheiphilus IPT5]
MRPIQIIFACCLGSLVAAAALPRLPESFTLRDVVRNISNRLVQTGLALGQDIHITPRQTTEDQIQDLDKDTFAASSSKDINPSATINGWDLHMCTAKCDNNHTVNTTKLFENKFHEDVYFYNATFQMCTRDYVACNADCIEAIVVKMENWPPKGAKEGEYLSSMDYEPCLSDCSINAMNNNNLLKGYPGFAVDPEHTGTFAMCNKWYGECCNDCHENFSDVVKKWQEDRALNG